MSATHIVPVRLAFKPEVAAGLAGVPTEAIHTAIAERDLTARYAEDECVILRADLVEWIDSLQERDLDSEKDAIIQQLRSRINELEHQILAEDPFLPSAVLKKHAPCMATPATTPRQAKDLYFMRCEGYVKIGVSQDPKRRLTQIRGGSALMPVGMDYRQTEIVRVIPGAGAREYPTHWQFSHLRHTGEWFTETPELTDYISALTKESK